MKLIKLILLTSIIMVSISQYALAFGRQFSPDLQKINKIYIGNMGEGNEAERFRMLLSNELSKKGFHIVQSPGTADATLTGILSLRVYDDTSIARATVTLKDKSGGWLWGDDFEPKWTLRNIKDTVKWRAQNIASALRKDCKKASKS